MFHIGSDTLCVATQKSGDTLAAPLPTAFFESPAGLSTSPPARAFSIVKKSELEVSGRHSALLSL